MICGIDEAGRGPVIGPMVMAGVCIEPGQEDNLERMGVKDSKFLSPQKREDLYERLIEHYKHEIIMISPEDIDKTLNNPDTNLNWLEGDTSIAILERLGPKKAILDCPSTNVEAYKEYVAKKLTKKIDLVVEHKADTNYFVVGAASILAKVTRDREIEKLKRIAGTDFGSGYPSDSRTVSFLKENYDKFDFFRKSWASYKKVAKADRRLDSF